MQVTGPRFHLYVASMAAVIGCGNAGSSGDAASSGVTLGPATSITASGTAADGGSGSGSGGGGLSQTAACASYLECATAVTPAMLGDLLQTYGPDGTCWQSTAEVADQCDQACVNGIAQLHEINPDEPSCQASGADSGADTGAGDCSSPPSYEADIQPLWDTYCTTACHEDGGEWFPLILTAPSYDNLVGATPTQTALLHEVEPGKLDKSYLWAKLQGMQIDVGGSGVNMPKPHADATMADVLSTDEMATIQTWITCNAPM